MALLVLKMPAAEASKVAERVLGRKLSRATLDREARRQGIKAQEKRDQMDQHPVLEQIKPASQRAGVEPKAFTLVIELDTWNIRERDHWGKTEKLRRKGEECGRFR